MVPTRNPAEKLTRFPGNGSCEFIPFFLGFYIYNTSHGGCLGFLNHQHGFCLFGVLGVFWRLYVNLYMYDSFLVAYQVSIFVIMIIILITCIYLAPSNPN